MKPTKQMIKHAEVIYSIAKTSPDGYWDRKIALYNETIQDIRIKKGANQTAQGWLTQGRIEEAPAG